MATSNIPGNTQGIRRAGMARERGGSMAGTAREAAHPRPARDDPGNHRELVEGARVC